MRDSEPEGIWAMLKGKKTAVSITLLVLVLLFTWIFLIHPIKLNPGQQAVLIDKPIIWGHGGIREEPIEPGRKYVWFSTDWFTVNMLPEQFLLHLNDFMSSDGVPLDFDSVIRLQVVDSVALIKNFGPGWYENNVKAEFSNRVRQAVRKHGMNETAIDTKAIDAIDLEITESMEKYLADAKIPVKLIQITVGKANPPDSIKHQRIETATQQQRIKTERERKLAEDSRKDAERSRASADNAYREAMQLNPDQFLRLEAIKMQRDVCSKEKSGCQFFITGADTGPVPVYRTNR